VIPAFRGSRFTDATQYTPSLALPPRIDNESVKGLRCAYEKSIRTPITLASKTRARIDGM